MKRVHLQKEKPVPCPQQETADSPSVQSELTPPGAKRKVRTSAAMIGLALSMGATSLLLPRQDDGAAAAEPKGTDSTISAALSNDSVSQSQVQPSEAAQFPTVRLVEHVVQDGQTLRQLANQYQIPVHSLTLVNGLSVDSALRAGQTLKVPISSSIATAVQATASPLVASADLNQLPAVDSGNRLEDSQIVDRNNALDRLRQQRDKLRDSLAELRSEESSLTANLSGESGSPQVNPSPVIAATLEALPSLPSVSAAQAVKSSQAPAMDVPTAASELLATRPSQPEVNTAGVQTYRVNPGDTIARIARAHNIPQSLLIDANRLSDPNVIFVGQVLTVPIVQSTNLQPAVTVASENLSPGVLPDSASNSANSLTTISSPIQPTTTAQTTPGTTVAQSSTTMPMGRQVAVAPLAEETGSIPTAPGIAPSTGSVDPELSSRFNPYVAGLLSEFRELRHRNQSAVAVTAQPSADLTPAVAANPTSSGNLAIAPHFGESLDRQGGGTLPVSSSISPSPSAVTQPELVAAAPLGSESYDPLLQPVTGRLVSPELPPLPGADTFLPEDGLFNGYIWPTRGMLTSGYGWRWGRMHQGIDIAADIGTPIHAAATGVVEFAGWNSGGYGNMVEIRHADGSMTRYAHMNAVYVEVGQQLDQGEQLGEMGSTGYSTGPHLHFEVHLPNQGTVNPIAYLPAE